MKKFAALVAVSVFLLSNLHVMAQEVYPFKVKLNGHEAAKSSETALFATIAKPVPANASIEVAATGQVIVNAFQCDADGNPIQAGVTAVLIFEAPKGSLDKTLDGKPLEKGKYLANIVAGGETSRIIFDVE